MRSLISWLLLTLAGLSPATALAASGEAVQGTDNAVPNQQQVKARVDNLQEPLYTPFVERYILDEVKQLRKEIADTKVEIIRDVVDREMALANQSVRYATDTVTYFFYLIAGATSLLVFVGWNSIRDMRERIQNVADKEIAELVAQYEARMETIESQLRKRSEDIEKNQEEIDITRELHSLWLRAAQEPVTANRLTIYDHILQIDPNNTEAMTYKADVVLEMGEPRWAADLCGAALQIDADNAHACYQMACACAQLEHREQAIDYLRRALDLAESYREEMATDRALEPLHGLGAFEALCGHETID